MVLSSNPAVTYQWQRNTGPGFQNLTNGGQYSGVDNDTLTISALTLANNGHWFRCVISLPGCQAVSGQAILKVDGVTGVYSVEANGVWQIYPNPASDGLHIQCEDAMLGSQYILRDASGRTCLSGLITNRETILRVSHLAAGVYVMQIQTNKGNLIRRIELMD